MNKSLRLHIGKRAFITSAVILLFLMFCAGILTRIVPQGSFTRVQLQNGNEAPVAGSFEYTDGTPLPVYRWFTAPFEVLFSQDGALVAVIIFFILAIGGTFSVLEKSGMLSYVLNRLVKRFSAKKYVLLAVLVLFFMLFGALFGIFEEVLAIVPLIVAFSCAMGWNPLVGLGASVLAACYGFSAALMNPFTLGVGQKLVGLPLFSGFLPRVFFFMVIYLIAVVFIVRYAKKTEKILARTVSVSLDGIDSRCSAATGQQSVLREQSSATAGRLSGIPDEFSGISRPTGEEVATLNLKKAVGCFGFSMAFSCACVVLSMFVPAVSSVIMPLTACILLIGGLLSARISRYGGVVPRDFLTGLLGVFPGVILILLAMSVKLIVQNGKVLDTLLFYAAEGLSGSSSYATVTLMYVLVLALNFFIPSGSAKAFLILPVIAPIADMIGITRQTAVQAFCFGDGFTNVFFPTNPLLMIALSVTGVSYAQWFKWTWKLQAVMFSVTLLMLFTCVAFGYGA